MKSTPDNPTDSLGTLGAPIRPAAPAPVDTAKPFETGDWAPKGLVITEKPAQRDSHGLPVVTDGQEADWEGLV